MKISFMGTQPIQGTSGAAGYDLINNGDSVQLRGSGFIHKFATGTWVEIPPGFAGLVLPRSGLATRHGITLINSPGLIDSDYRGEISITLVNFGCEPFVIEHGMRIGQLVIVRHEQIEWEEITKLSDTKRGTGGLGSTGL